MSAAAQSVPQRRSRSIPVPQDMRGQVTLPTGHVRVSPEFYVVCRRKCPGGRLELLFLEWLWEQCYGGNKQRGGEYVRPEWVPVQTKWLADDFIASEDGLLQAISSLEHQETPLIEGRLLGKTKWFRLCPENFEAAADREKATVRKPAGSDEDLHIRTVSPGEPLLLLPGAQSRPIALSDTLSVRYRHNADFTVRIHSRPAEDGLIDIDLDLKPDLSSNLSEVCADRRTTVRRSARDLENKGLGNLGNALNGHSKIEISSMRELLARWCGSRIGSPDDATVEAALTARGSTSMTECAQRLNQLTRSRRDLTWPMVVDAIAGKPVPTEEQRKDEGSSADSFNQFLTTFTDCGLAGSRDDYETARERWKDLDIADRLAAVEGLRARKLSGEFNDPAFYPLPQNFLKKRMWERPIRSSRKSKADEFKEMMSKL